MNSFQTPISLKKYRLSGCKSQSGRHRNDDYASSRSGFFAQQDNIFSRKRGLK